jgi:hypothetical protein
MPIQRARWYFVAIGANPADTRQHRSGLRPGFARDGKSHDAKNAGCAVLNAEH